MAWPKALEPYKEQISGFAGAGFGLSTSELAAEFTARATGQMGYFKAALKTFVKIILGALYYGAGKKAAGAWRTFGEVAGYSSWGSIIMDWIQAAYPGGIPGFAERLAVSARVWAMGAERVAAEIRALERVGVGATTKSISELAMAQTTAPTAGARFRVVRD